MPTGAGGATAAPGFPSREALLERYAERTGRDLSNLDYYVGFNRWKSAAIVHGVYARYMEGKKSTEGIDLPEMRQRIVQDARPGRRSRQPALRPHTGCAGVRRRPSERNVRGVSLAPFSAAARQGEAFGLAG